MVAPLLNINLEEFKRNKRNIKENFKEILEKKSSLKQFCNDMTVESVDLEK